MCHVPGGRPQPGQHQQDHPLHREVNTLVSGGGRKSVDITTYTAVEGYAYLRERLADFAHLLDEQAADLVEAVGRLPLALAHAAAYMINKRKACREYLRLFNDRRQSLEAIMPRSADTENYGRQVTAALLLSLDAAQSEEPVGLALPAMRLAALLDPTGHPRALWTQPAVTDYLTAWRSEKGERSAAQPLEEHRDEPRATAVSPDEALEALNLLHKYNLLTDDPWAEPRAVTSHALTTRATRERTPEPQTKVMAEAAAEALLGLWPDADHSNPDLTLVLRTNTDTLGDHARDLLWDRQRGGHPLLFRSGQSLSQIGLHSAAVLHWRQMVGDSERLLRADHPNTLTARNNLGNSYQQAGRTAEAIAILEKVAADSERLLGADHLHTLTARNNLGNSYQQAGRTAEAIAILEELAADSERLLGADHPTTMTARNNLAASYWQAGRTAEAIAILEQVAADRDRLLGPDHADTLTARGNVAASYRRAGRTGEAIAIEEEVAADSERLLGADHPDTLSARNNLAASYWQAGRTGEAIAILEQVAADRDRLLGPGHPDTLTSRGNCAAAYGQAGRTEEGITLFEQVAADSERLLGPDHLTTLTVRANQVLLLLEAAKAELPDSPLGAWDHAVNAVKIAGPLTQPWPIQFGPLLRDSYLVAAQALNADEQPEEAERLRRLAHGAISAG